MSKVLSIDDMLEAATECDLPNYEDHVDALEAAATDLAKALAKHLKIKTTFADWEGKAYGGLCAPFYPVTKKQRCPKVIEEGDEGGDWVTEPVGPCSLCGKDTPVSTAHLHQGKWIGECCWDDRLKSTE